MRSWEMRFGGDRDRDRDGGGGGLGGLGDLLGGKSGGEGEGKEMVERFTREIGDVLEGKKSWVELLRDVVSGGGSPSGSPSASQENLAKRRKR